MRKTWLAFLLLVIGCGKPVAQETSSPTREIALGADPVVKTLLTCPVGEMPNVIEGDNVLKPDERFVIAASELVEMIQGRETVASATYSDRQWLLTAGAVPIGTAAENSFIRRRTHVAPELGRRSGTSTSDRRRREIAA